MSPLKGMLENEQKLKFKTKQTEFQRNLATRAIVRASKSDTPVYSSDKGFHLDNFVDRNQKNVERIHSKIGGSRKKRCISNRKSRSFSRVHGILKPKYTGDSKKRKRCFSLPFKSMRGNSNGQSVIFPTEKTTLASIIHRKSMQSSESNSLHESKQYEMFTRLRLRKISCRKKEKSEENSHRYGHRSIITETESCDDHMFNRSSENFGKNLYRNLKPNMRRDQMSYCYEKKFVLENGDGKISEQLESIKRSTTNSKQKLESLTFSTLSLNEIIDSTSSRKRKEDVTKKTKKQVKMSVKSAKLNTDKECKYIFKLGNAFEKTSDIIELTCKMPHRIGISEILSIQKEIFEKPFPDLKPYSTQSTHHYCLPVLMQNTHFEIICIDSITPYLLMQVEEGDKMWRGVHSTCSMTGVRIQLSGTKENYVHSRKLPLFASLKQSLYSNKCSFNGDDNDGLVAMIPIKVEEASHLRVDYSNESSVPSLESNSIHTRGIKFFYGLNDPLPRGPIWMQRNQKYLFNK